MGSLQGMSMALVAAALLTGTSVAIAHGSPGDRKDGPWRSGVHEILDRDYGPGVLRPDDDDDDDKKHRPPIQEVPLWIQVHAEGGAHRPGREAHENEADEKVDKRSQLRDWLDVIEHRGERFKPHRHYRDIEDLGERQHHHHAAPPAPVPLPAGVLLLGSGLLGFAGFLRRRMTTTREQGMSNHG